MVDPDPLVELPPPCLEPCPPDPSVFSDASVERPACPYLSLGGIGVWTPHSRFEEVAPSALEEQYLHSQDTPYGLRQ